MTDQKKVNVAVVGATGAVGNQMIACLEERNFPLSSLRLLASSRSAGKKLPFRGEMLPVEELTARAFEGMDIALFSAGGQISARFAPQAADRGCVVVDNSSAWRIDPEVPLVVPEVNDHAIAGYTARGIIANPNCSTIQMVVVLHPIYRRYGIRRIVVSTYQAVSGTGKRAIDELTGQTRAILNGAAADCAVYPHPIAFNCLPHIDAFLDNGYTKEEMKMVNETRKILEDDTLAVSATTVRVPVFYGHSEAVNVETRKHAEATDVRELLRQAPGVKVVDDPATNRYPLATDAQGQDLTLVGRIRQDESIAHGINLWVVADNIRKGAATNTIQIAELLVEKYL